MKKNTRLILLLAIIKFTAPYLLQNGYFEPHRDEYLYLAEGHHLAWGFMEVPPLLSIFAWLTHFLGDGLFWVKFWPNMFGVMTFIVIARIIQKLNGGTLAIFLAFLPFIFGVYLRLFFLFQPNTPEVFFWTMIAYSIVCYIQTSKNKYLYLLGVSIGLGIVSKYSVLIFAVSILAGLAVTRQRKVFGNRHLYYAGMIAFLLVFPTMYWEYSHHFPIVVHMRQLNDRQLQYVSPKSFLIDQLVMNLPCVFIWLAGLYFTILTQKGEKYRSFAWAYIIVIVLLLIFHGKNYYALGVYPIFIAFGASLLENFSLRRAKAWRWAFVLLPCLLGFVFIPIWLPVFTPSVLDRYYKMMHIEKTGALKWEDLQNHPLPQDFADMIGWEEMARKMATAYNSLDSVEKEHTFLFCDNYGEAGAINYYRYKYHLPEVYSDNGSFLYWIPPKLHLENLILVTDDHDEMQHPFIKNFQSAIVSDSVTNIFARERGTLVIIFKGANQTMNNMFQEKIAADFKLFQ